MGRVAAPYGVKGWIKILPLTSDPDTLLSHAQWWIRRRQGDGQWAMHILEGGRRHGATLVAQLGGLVDREAAAGYGGADIGVPRESLPAAADGEFYWSDLEGLQVVNRQGISLGKVVSVRDYGAHPVLRVENESGVARLVPFVEAYVDAVSIAEGRIDVDWQPDY